MKTVRKNGIKKEIPKIPKIGSRAAQGFFVSFKEINRFFHFVLHMVAHIETASKVAHSALVDTEHDELKKQKMVSEWKERKGPVDELKVNRQFFLEVILVRHIENFLAFIAALLYEIFTQRPETLRSSESMEIAKILKHDSIESLVREIAERKIESLSYSSFHDILNFFQDRFNLKLIDNETDLKEIVEAIETRNISVHNRCIINQRFINRLKLTPEKLGIRKELYSDTIDKIIPLLTRLVLKLDRQASTKLHLKNVRFNAKGN